jgi:hypothetical protein
VTPANADVVNAKIKLAHAYQCFSMHKPPCFLFETRCCGRLVANRQVFHCFTGGQWRAA